MNLRDLYYSIKPLIPRSVQLSMRRALVRKIRSRSTDIWPIDPASAPDPQGRVRWPENKEFALVLTHDVDTWRGAKHCEALAEIEKDLGFRSSFNFVPERYPIPQGVMERLRQDGHEVGVHGLYHDGQLYKSRQVFDERAIKINRYIQEWGASGFRSPAMHHNLEWLHQLEVLYDASTFDTDPFEPQPDGMQTILPFIVTDADRRHEYVELPYTLAQDFTLFVLMQETDISIWTRKLAWVAGQRGMALINTHPDYMDFGDGDRTPETYPVQYYIEFLQHIKDQYTAGYWHTLPAAIAQYWKEAAHGAPFSTLHHSHPGSATSKTASLCAA
jgi:hypothetical protein